MSRDYDVVVVGGGIHGAGVAQAAAVAGHSVLLLEQSDLAAGSSSRSSKLIHGGLRYLESGQLRLVRESLHERATLLRIAPGLVRLQRFHIPIYRRTRRRPWQLQMGLSAYALLSGFGPGASFGTVPRRQWTDLDGLDTHELEAVYWYHDGQTDDEKLTRAVVKSAQSFGADVAMPARFAGATLDDDSVRVRYVSRDAGVECRARVLVNAAGPWAADVARQIAPAIEVPSVDLVQGAHLAVSGRLQHGLYYVESPRDGRAVFVMPWREQVLVGTTEVRFRGEPGAARPSSRELQYLLAVLRHYFLPYRHIHDSDVTTSFAGLRVLPSGSGHAFHRSRETMLVTDRTQRPRVMAIYGGKLTTYRAVAERVLGRIAESLPARPPKGKTDQIALAWQ